MGSHCTTISISRYWSGKCMDLGELHGNFRLVYVRLPADWSSPAQTWLSHGSVIFEKQISSIGRSQELFSNQVLHSKQVYHKRASGSQISCVSLDFTYFHTIQHISHAIKCTIKHIHISRVRLGIRAEMIRLCKFSLPCLSIATEDYRYLLTSLLQGLMQHYLRMLFNKPLLQCFPVLDMACEDHIFPCMSKFEQQMRGCM